MVKYSVFVCIPTGTMVTEGRQQGELMWTLKHRQLCVTGKYLGFYTSSSFPQQVRAVQTDTQQWRYLLSFYSDMFAQIAHCGKD